jgi:hypothetical protein
MLRRSGIICCDIRLRRWGWRRWQLVPSRRQPSGRWYAGIKLVEQRIIELQLFWRRFPIILEFVIGFEHEQWFYRIVVVWKQFLLIWRIVLQ